MDTQSQRDGRNPSFRQALLYPFRRPKGLCNVLWLFLPIIGWLIFAGYITRIVQEFCRGKYEKLPPAPAIDLLGTGFFIILKSLPFIIVLSAVLLILDPYPLLIGIVLVILYTFIVPILTVQFLFYETARSLFWWRPLRHVYNHISDYLIALAKSVLLMFLYVAVFTIVLAALLPLFAIVPAFNTAPVLYAVTVIAGVILTASGFVQHFFIADFYRRRVLRQ